ncbi:MAG: carbohydrate ABC transporter substrate-binding protein [Chloroflexi bacterium]|nr:MAG: carbohydrate ABC transporter substrate-binding protein [Chloroflexota bacterium]
MRKSVLHIFGVLVILALALSACGAAATPQAAQQPAEEKPAAEEKAAEQPAQEEAAEKPAEEAPAAEKTVLKVWSFTNEINTMAVAFEGKHPNVDVQYTMIPMTNGEYQTKLKAAMGTADAPDVIALEAAFVKELVESNVLADISDLLPEAEAAKTYPFVIDVGTNNGVLKALSYQATPGALFYRRSLAKEYFGTDDPAEIQALLSDMDKFTQAAAVIKEKSGGNTYMVGSSGDFQNPFFANRAQPWIVDDTLVVDPMVEKYVEIAKMFRDEGYEAQAQQWQEGWFAGMNDSLVDAEGNPKQVFSYFLPTWGLPYVLAPNAASADGSHDTSGDWAVISGPLPYQWGGTWVGVVDGSANADLAKEFVRFVALDEENLTNWATGVYTNEFLKAIDPQVPDDQQQAPGDFVSSQVVVDKIVSSFDDSELSAFLAGQNSYAGFAEAAPSVNAKLMTGSDDAIQRALGDPLNQYLNGEITEDEMWATWKDALRIEFPDLIIN